MMGQDGSMAMEDACVLAECLRRDTTVGEALPSVARVSWVHQESDAVAQSFRLPAAMRNAALRQYGDQMLQRRFAGFAGIVQDYLAALSYDEEIHCGPVDWVALEQWHRGRVVRSATPRMRAPR